MRKETLEEAAKKYAEEYKGEEQDPWFDFIEGAKWQQERSYSEEDMMKAVKFGELYNTEGSKSLFEKKGTTSSQVLRDWFNTFKKK